MLQIFDQINNLPSFPFVKSDDTGRVLIEDRVLAEQIGDENPAVWLLPDARTLSDIEEYRSSLGVLLTYLLEVNIVL